MLRAIEEEGAKRRAAEIIVYAAPLVALYVLNNKRERLEDELGPENTVAVLDGLMARPNAAARRRRI